MSAGPKAVPLSKENPDWIECTWGFTCQCGHKGIAHELLCEIDNSTLYCPQCECAAWTWD